MNFSVVLIARNEEKTLPRLISSLTEFKEKGGEIVLVDTGSTDKTAEVARSLGIKVTEVGDRFRRVIDADLAKEINDKFLEPGENPVVASGESLFDYSSARNFAASLASNDMVAMPDCDEVYTKLDLAAVEDSIKKGAEQLEYQFVFAHDADGNALVQFLHCKFYNRTKLRWVGIIHEVLSGNANRVYLEPGIIKLEHWQNHETNRSGYLKGLALDCFENPDNDRNSHYFGRELVWTGRPKSAIRELIRHVGMNRWEPERSQSAIFIAQAYLSIENEERAVEWWHKALQIHSGRREPLIRLMDHYYRKGDAQRTILYGEAALTIPESSFYANDASHYRQVPHEALYWAYWVIGAKDRSREHWKRCLEFQPTNSKYLHDARFYESLPTVDIVLPTLGREDSLKKAVESVKALNYPAELVNLTVLDGEGTVPQKVKTMVDSTKGDWICFAANDIEFDPDSLILAILEGRRLDVDLVSFNTGPLLPDEGNICEHFIFRRSRLPLIGGEVFDTEFRHVGVDNLLWAKCKKMNSAVRCEKARIKHKHFSKDPSVPFDSVYQKGWSDVEKDRELLAKKLASL